MNPSAFEQNERVNASIGVKETIVRFGFALLLLQCSCPSFAQFSGTATGTAHYEYDSNVFDLQNGFAIAGGKDYQRSDDLYAVGAGADMSYLVGQQKLFATLTTTEFRYDHFTELDHTEYKVDAGWNWRLGAALDGTLDVLRYHFMLPFIYTNTAISEYTLEADQRETAKAGFLFLPDWRLEGNGAHRTSDQEIQGLPSIDLTESSGQAALRYLGVAGLSSGLSAGYLTGHYSGASSALNPSYRQTNLSLVATYEPTGRSTFNGTLGYSDRTSNSAIDAVAGFTGSLDYRSQLTGLTTLDLQLSRAINSYLANVSSEVDTTIGLSVRWQVTYKTGFLFGYSWTHRDLPGQGNAPDGSTRIDRLQYGSIKIDYEPLEWLSIIPYLNVQARHSNFVGGNFDSTACGLYFVVQWQTGPERGTKFQLPYVPYAPGT